MMEKYEVRRHKLTFNVNFNVHTMTVRALVVNVLVDLNQGH